MLINPCTIAANIEWVDERHSSCHNQHCAKPTTFLPFNIETHRRREHRARVCRLLIVNNNKTLKSKT